jgi:hypothetical protein
MMKAWEEFCPNLHLCSAPLHSSAKPCKKVHMW